MDHGEEEGKGCHGNAAKSFIVPENLQRSDNQWVVVLAIFIYQERSGFDILLCYCFG